MTNAVSGNRAKGVRFCPECKEPNDPQYETCWNCDYRFSPKKAGCMVPVDSSSATTEPRVIRSQEEPRVPFHACDTPYPESDEVELQCLKPEMHSGKHATCLGYHPEWVDSDGLLHPGEYEWTEWE